jgi:hypothetical protein
MAADYHPVEVDIGYSQDECNLVQGVCCPVGGVGH